MGALGTKRNLTTLRAQRKHTRRVSTPNPLGLRHARHGGWPAARCGRCLAARSRVRDVLIGHPRGHMQRRERGGAPLEVLHWHPPHGEGGCFARCELAEFSMDFAPDCSYMLVQVSRSILARADSRVEGLRQCSALTTTTHPRASATVARHRPIELCTS